MKRVIPFIFILIIIMNGCGSSKKQLRKGNYDAAIEKAVKQLRKDPRDNDQIDILSQSYKIANEQDNERVRFLKMEGRPNSWDEIYLVFKALNERQSLVRTVTPLNYNGKSIDFPYVDYMSEMVNAKRKAADFYYLHGTELLKSGVKESYRQAFTEFMRAKQYIGDYEGIDRHKTVQYALIETVQSKECHINGDIEVIQMNPERVVKKDPVGAQSGFEHVSSRALGDKQALNAKQLERTKSAPVPFPTDIEMVLRCSESLKMAIKGGIQNNRRFIY